MAVQRTPVMHSNVPAEVTTNLRSRFWQQFFANRITIVALVVLGLLIGMAISAPLITPGVNASTNYLFEYGNGTHGPSFDHFPALIFGLTGAEVTDLSERSVLTEVTFGARVSLTVSITAGILASLIGALAGAYSGYFGGWLDWLLMRITDVFLAIPFIPLVVAVAILIPDAQIFNSLPSIILLFTTLSWPSVALVTRSQFLQLREQDYAETARAMGIGRQRIILRHLMPNALPTILTATMLNIAAILIAESTLDFLTIGFTSQMTWGNALANTDNDILYGAWWSIFFPGFFIALTVMAFGTVGEAFRQAFDVREYRH